MKRYLLSLLTLVIIFSSCEKEADLLQPIPTPPTTQTTLIDTLTTDSIISTTLEGLEEEYVVIPNNPTTNNNFIGEGKTWKITESKFIMNCGELTDHVLDTSYSFTTNPYALNSSSTISFNDDPYNLGEDVMTVNVYPRNVGTQLAPTHAVDMAPKWLTFYIDNYSYSTNKLTMDLNK